jgi:hypothetical protein
MGDTTYSAVSRPGSPAAPWFADVLEAIEQFGLASIGLVAWEMFLTEEELVPAWRQMKAMELIERVGRCPYTREPMYRLSAPRETSVGGAGDVAGTGFLGATDVNVVTRLTGSRPRDPGAGRNAAAHLIAASTGTLRSDAGVEPGRHSSGGRRAADLLAGGRKRP